MPVYKAIYERTSVNGFRGDDLIYEASSGSDAAEAFKRFYDNRRREVPEWFGVLMAVKIYEFTILPIDEEGRFQSRDSLFGFEWKIDMGWTYEERVGYLKALEARK